MQSKHRYERTAEGELVPKETLIRLILNRNSQQLQANPYTLASRKSFRIKIGRSPSLVAEYERGDFGDFLRECTARKHRLEHGQRLRLVRGYLNLEATGTLRNCFILLFSEAYLAQVAHPQAYELLLASIPQYPQTFFTVISKDIPRTFPPSTSSAPLLTNSLRNVLFAYAIRNPHVLYCQGLNYVAGHFLSQGFTEQQVFWILVYLIEQALPSDYYVDMGSVICMGHVLRDIVAEMLPELMAMFDRVGLELSMLVVPWLVCLFTKGFGRELTEYMVGLAVIQGKVGLLKCAIAILKLIGPKLDEADLADLLKQFNQQSQNLSVRDFKLVYDSLYINQYFSNTLLDCYLREYWQRSQAQSKQDALKGHNLLPECNPAYPICLHIIELNRRFRTPERDVYTLRLGRELVCDEEYFMEGRVGGKRREKLEGIEEVMIGRHRHICQCLEGRKKELSKVDFERILKDNLDDDDTETESKLILHEPPRQPINLETKPQEQDHPTEPPRQRMMRKVTLQKMQNLAQLFSVVKDFAIKQIDVVDQAVNEHKQSKLSKRTSLLKVRGQTSNFLTFFKKMF